MPVGERPEQREVGVRVRDRVPPLAQPGHGPVALAALRHRDELLGRVDDLRAERDATVAWLREQGLEVADSDANFALFGRFADRHAVWQALLDHGVLIRETGPDGWLRVSIGTAEEMTAFKNALTDVLREGPR